MQIFIFVLIILVCVFLALIVLIQNPKGGGLDSSFASANQIGGVKRTADFLEKSTWTLAVALFVLCLVSASIESGNIEGDALQQFEETPLEQPQIPTQDTGAEEAPAE
jgi:preprotein translocase subunit SecG